MNLAMYKAHLLNSKPPYAWQQSPRNFGKVSSRPFCSNTILFQLVQSGILGMLVTFAALVVLFLLHLSMIHLNWLVLCYLLCTTSALYESKANFNNGYMPPNNFWINIFCACQQKLLKCVQKKSRLTNCRFTTISSQISAIYMNIFHKTVVQAVILRCWMGLHLNWFKSYDKKCKFFHFRCSAIL